MPSNSRGLEAEIGEQMHRLRVRSPHSLLMETAEKRASWAREKSKRFAQAPTPREAYELFLLEYLRLVPDSVPVVSETEVEIVWDSRNDCPTLEACLRLGRDTREVCRNIYEKSTQAFFSALDPHLRFQRSYRHIRPYEGSCREAILRVDFESMMSVAIEEGRASLSEGNQGYGAVIALGKEILAAAHDTLATEGDTRRHAERKVIDEALAVVRSLDLMGCVLFTTCEPCFACTSLATQANLTSIVFGVAIEETAGLAKASIAQSCREVVRRAPTWLEVIGGCLESECRSLYFR